MPSIWQLIFRWGWRLVLAAVLFFNLRLYNAPPLPSSDHAIAPSLMKQLKANRKAIDNGAPAAMQRLFPEGAYFCYVLHGLTWVEAALRQPDLTEQAIDEAKHALLKLDSQECKSPFSPDLPPDHGMFYSAWKAHLQAGLVLLQEGQNAPDLESLQAQCDSIVDSLSGAESPFLASYRGCVWPCDTVPAIHALKIYDHVTEENRYQDVIVKWVSDVSERFDPGTGLISHTANVHDGHPNSGARATSQVVMLRMLPDIAPQLSGQQYEIFRNRYLNTLIGIPCVREYPTGVYGEGDIDSGPLIFERCLSGTVFMIGLTQIYGDQEVANAIATTGEVVGLPWTNSDEKRYVGGVLPVGDIMVTYSQNACCWLGGSAHHPTEPHAVSKRWRWPVHLISMLLLIPTAIGLLRNKATANL